MIEKMKFIRLTGPEDDIDRVAASYLSHHEIHLENALTELADVHQLTPYQQTNPYRDLLVSLRSFEPLIPADTKPGEAPTGIAATSELLSALETELSKDRDTLQALMEKREDKLDNLKMFSHFRALPADVQQILQYHYVDFRFGKFPRESYEKFKTYVYEDFDTFFYRCGADETNIYGIFFAPLREIHQIDAVYSSMHFERIFIPDGYSGTPEEICAGLSADAEALNQEIDSLQQKMQAVIAADAPRLLSAKAEMERFSGYFDIRKKAALFQIKEDTFYILCGWMTEKETAAFLEEIKGDEKLVAVVEEPDASTSTPPTRLKNPALFKPYEMYVEMYGLPNYREIDPTIFIAITYSFIFGAMFGDFGQGLVLLLGGFLLYHFRHIKLAGIISCAGVFSTLFGLLFGSFFGFEDTVIKHIWLKPKEATISLPGIGNTNTVLVCAIVFGMFLILTTMVFNILNSRRLGDKEGELFGTNSLVGFLFYTGVIIVAFTLFGNGNGTLAAWFLVLFIALPLVIMFCKEPLTAFLTKKPKGEKEGPVMFFVQSFFEMFETLLSFFSNTLSFVRIGAFAVSHAAMMEVVLMLSGAEKGQPNWVAVILGNLFVMGMEGLIVGIQVLRLEYYELFSRFYRGDGKPFTPFQNEATKGGNAS